MVRDKLQALCRELQKENKAVKQQAVRQAEESAEERRALLSKVDASIKDISARWGSHGIDSPRAPSHRLRCLRPVALPSCRQLYVWCHCHPSLV